MSQQEVSEFFKKHKTEWFTIRELATYLTNSRNSISNNVRRLKKRGDVISKMHDNGKAVLYRYRSQKEHI
jgi:hypothetical protein